MASWHAVRFAPARRARGRPIAARRRRWSVPPVRGRDGGAAASPSEPRLTRDRVTVRGRRAVGARPLEHEPAGSGTRCRSATRLGTLYGFGAYRLRGGPRTRLARRPPGAAMGAAPRACSAQRGSGAVRACGYRRYRAGGSSWRRRSPYSSVASAYGYRVPRYPGRAPSAEPRTARRPACRAAAGRASAIPFVRDDRGIFDHMVRNSPSSLDTAVWRAQLGTVRAWGATPVTRSPAYSNVVMSHDRPVAPACTSLILCSPVRSLALTAAVSSFRARARLARAAAGALGDHDGRLTARGLHWP